MRAALFEGAGKPLVIANAPDPTRRDDEVIIEVTGCGICGSDLHVTETGFLPAGSILGHEFAGTVVETAAGGPAIGTRVTALPYRACMSCDDCAEGAYAHCPQLTFVGIGLPGAFADYVAVPQHFVQKLPAGVSFEFGALVEPLAVAHHAVGLAGPIRGADVLILGGGPIGAAAVLFAAMQGARHIVVSEPSPHRRALCQQLGATASADPLSETIGARFAALAGRAPDVVMECAGIPGLLQQAIGLVRHRGCVVVAGVVFGEDKFLPMTAISKEVTLRFSSAYTVQDFSAVIEAMAHNIIAPAPMLTDRIPLDALPAAFEALRTPSRQCKVLVDLKMAPAG